MRKVDWNLQSRKFTPSELKKRLAEHGIIVSISKLREWALQGKHGLMFVSCERCNSLREYKCKVMRLKSSNPGCIIIRSSSELLSLSPEAQAGTGTDALTDTGSRASSKTTPKTIPRTKTRMKLGEAVELCLKKGVVFRGDQLHVV